jgi:hypothetical protein
MKLKSKFIKIVENLSSLKNAVSDKMRMDNI